VNPDVLNSLVFNAREEARLVVKRSMPDVVAGFGAPAGFTLIGSGMRAQPYPSTVVAYKTSLAGDKAFDNWLAFLAADGWSRDTPPGAQQPTVSVAGPPPLATTLCRNGERRAMRVQEIEGVRYATITGIDLVPSYACNAPDPRQNGFGMNSPMVEMNAIRANLPQFSFPATARMVGPGMGDMSSGSSSTRIASPDTAASLAGQLASQLVSQGWRGDANWSGALSTGSTWTRKGDGGQSLLGTLEILDIGQGVYNIGFTVANRGQ
jgi:hypothetical protein